ncbi:hypothetical protein CDAR_412191 [Caerostris darwini]|uniref:Uncharacterized protein n=1 Tax=Caerostris darwini TaxID=1538125 RepID=A0AAV4WF18_9ARAC|nr:hypothetical protein CDAR_412191 [Caerostris darwini]
MHRKYRVIPNNLDFIGGGREHFITNLFTCRVPNPHKPEEPDAHADGPPTYSKIKVSILLLQEEEITCQLSSCFMAKEMSSTREVTEAAGTSDTSFT